MEGGQAAGAACGRNSASYYEADVSQDQRQGRHPMRNEKRRSPRSRVRLGMTQEQFPHSSCRRQTADRNAPRSGDRSSRRNAEVIFEPFLRSLIAAVSGNYCRPLFLPRTIAGGRDWGRGCLLHTASSGACCCSQSRKGTSPSLGSYTPFADCPPPRSCCLIGSTPPRKCSTVIASFGLSQR